MIEKIYGTSLGLLTDLYQLTMAYGYWKNGKAEDDAVFNLFFRKNPFKGDYAVAAGLEFALDYIERFYFEADDLAYLATLQGNDDRPLFEPAFLDFLGDLRFTGELYGVAEGRVVFPHEPLLRVRAPLIQGQLLETPLLNMINFQTLIATKAARICRATQGEPVLEFGLRRAQGIDGALSAARAAYIGGCGATSNVLAGRLFGIPVKGTHAHSWVMSFHDEHESFQAYADAMPNNCVFLVDTYDTVEGVRRAIEVGRRLRENGHCMVGIRLDSGDLADLSKQARVLLDDAGFDRASIVASNDLDEYTIEQLKRDGAEIDVWGVGTRLVTAYDQPALGGVYKLSAIRSPGEAWQYRIKLSEEAIKVSNPGIQQVKRLTLDGRLAGDIIYDEELGFELDALDLADPNKKLVLPDAAEKENLLKPLLKNGARVYTPPTLDVVRKRASAELEQLPETPVPVGLEHRLMAQKQTLMQTAEVTS